MRFIYTNDLHGDINKYEKLIQQCKNNNIKYIVVGGDLFSKNEKNRLISQKEFIDNYLDEYYTRLEDNQIEYIGIVGNDDLELSCEYYKEMIKNHKNIHDIDRNKYDTEGISFIGLSSVLDTPFIRKDHVVMETSSEMPPQKHDRVLINKSQKEISAEEWAEYRKNLPEMKDILKDLPKATKNNKIIFVFHNPPAYVKLDICNREAEAGSKDMYNFIKNSNAYLSLHGHIHESYEKTGVWKALIGNTIVIQPGQTEKDNEDMIIVIIDTDKNTYKREKVKVKN